MLNNALPSSLLLVVYVVVIVVVFVMLVVVVGCVIAIGLIKFPRLIVELLSVREDAFVLSTCDNNGEYTANREDRDDFWNDSWNDKLVHRDRGN